MKRLRSLSPLIVFLALAGAGCDAQDPGAPEFSAEVAASDEDSDGAEWADSDGEDASWNEASPDDFDAEIDPAEVGFPTSSCRSGFNQPHQRICVSGVRSSDRYLAAQRRCRASRARVCTREDYFYIYSGPNGGSYNANGQWLGNTVGDDQALCGNRSVTSRWDSDMWNFDGTCNVQDQRQFRCCHDDE